MKLSFDTADHFVTYSDLKVGDIFTTEKKDGLFVKTDENGRLGEQGVVVVASSTHIAIPAGNPTGPWGRDVKLLKVTELKAKV